MTERKAMNLFHYLPIFKYNISMDLYVTGVGKIEVPPGSGYPPKGHPDIYDFQWRKGRVLPEYQILYIRGGSGVFESLHSDRIRLEAGCAVLLFPGVWHRYKPDRQTGWKEYWLSWNGEYLYRLSRRNLFSPAKPVIEIDRPGRVESIYREIWELAREHPAENSQVLAARGMELLALILESEPDDHIPQEENPAVLNRHIDDQVVADAMRLIWNHTYRSISVEQVVESLPVSRRTLERRFHRFVGHSIGMEITRCRIERARHMLINTRLPIEHIALAVGFSGADRLGKVFRQSENMTPGRYRALHCVS